MAYSLQNRKSEPVEPVIAGDGPLVLTAPVRVAPGPRFLGEFVRSEGPARRFVYIAIGVQAGQHGSAWSRRAKIDVHDLQPALIEAALAGGGAGGGPAGAGQGGRAGVRDAAADWGVAGGGEV